MTDKTHNASPVPDASWADLNTAPTDGGPILVTDGTQEVLVFWRFNYMEGKGSWTSFNDFAELDTSVFNQWKEIQADLCCNCNGEGFNVYFDGSDGGPCGHCNTVGSVTLDGEPLILSR
jgi:hypothetical protein